MSGEEDIIKDAIERAYWGGVLGGEKYFEKVIAELRSLQAESEAWRSVRERWQTPGSPTYKLDDEFRRQIARLDAMKEGK